MTSELLRQLADLSGALTSEHDWPGEQFRLLARAGVLGWVIPETCGGAGVSQPHLIDGYVRLASACLTTAFVLTQRNGACQRIAASPNDRLKADLLPALSRGELFATVGISHLTTSRQYLGRPAVTAEPGSSGYRFRGDVPWVTGAGHAQFIVTGGALSDGKQLLAAIPADSAGLSVGPPARLLALGASQTSSVTLDNVAVDKRFIIAGPVVGVMKQGGGSTGSLATSALAVGLSLAAIARLDEESARRPDLADIITPLRDESTALEVAVLRASELEGAPADPALSTEAIRARANSLVLRSTQALLAASKGAGFVAGHFAERAVREALFFLVWSCPQPVVNAALRELAGLGTCE